MLRLRQVSTEEFSGWCRSISAFAPICNPSQVPWGKKAFSGYLGDDQSQWKQYDAVELLRSYSGPQLEVGAVQARIGDFAPQKYSSRKLLPAMPLAFNTSR